MATQTFEMQAITVSQAAQPDQHQTTSTTLQPQTVIAPQQTHQTAAQTLQAAQQFVQIATGQQSNTIKDSARQPQTIIAQPQQAHQTTTQTLQAAQQFVQVATGQPSNTVKDPSRQTTTLTLQTTAQGGPQAAVYQGHVQYVDGGDHTSPIYANGAMANNYPYSEATTMYAQPTPITSGTYFTSAAGSGIMTSGNLQTLGSATSVGGTGTMMVGGSHLMGGTVIGSSQLVAQPGGTYVLQGHTMMDGEGLPIRHTTRASPATVQWLLDNFETAEGVSLPRSTLYYHYLRHCTDNKLDPVNAASFGKLIRSVFLGLRTRRLGTRGNSKYHYYGIRIKSSSILNQYQDDTQQHTAMRQQPLNSAKRFKPSQIGGKIEADGSGAAGQQGGQSEAAQTQAQQHQQFLGDATQALPAFDELKIEDSPLPEGLTADDVKEFESLYREHCESVLDVVVNLQFALIESLWQTFWRNQPEDESSNEENSNQEEKLSKVKLVRLCQCENIQEYIKSYDHILYQGLVEVLIPDVLRPIPSALTQAIRNFAKSLEGWLKNSMNGIPQEMVSIKVGAVTAFAQTLRRYTSLNHLAQAARAVLQNTSQINQMLSDLNRVDFANVQEQASWVCQCEDKVVQKLEQDFKRTLQQQNSLEQWASWLEGVVSQVLSPHENSPNFAKAARQFLLKWSFYSSMVIRDLTLRSAASFGSFHLIRLLYDEYMFYLIEHRVATATGETPIAVMDKVDGRGERLMNSSSSNAAAATASTTTNGTANSITTLVPKLSSSKTADTAAGTIHNSSSITPTKTVTMTSIANPLANTMANPLQANTLAN